MKGRLFAITETRFCQDGGKIMKLDKNVIFFLQFVVIM